MNEQFSQSSERFAALPTRIFLDTSVLQTLQDYGGFIWENEEPSPDASIHRVPGGYQELDALRSIFLVNGRALFEFALSEHSLSEVAARRDSRFLQWAYDVMDHWEACLFEYGEAFTGEGHILAAKLDGPQFGNLSAGDRLLLRDALELECHAFLTMERRLPTRAAHVQQEVGIHILRPSQYWELLKPWARLFL
jgi:hypothetical protein